MKIHRYISSTTAAPESTFTGDVQIGDYFRRPAPSRLACARVTFPAGSRTPWKMNPLGQTIVITDGIGLAQTEGEEIIEIRRSGRERRPDRPIPRRRHRRGVPGTQKGLGVDALTSPRRGRRMAEPSKCVI